MKALLCLIAAGVMLTDAFAQSIDQKLLTGKRWYLCRAENADGSTIKNRKPCEKDNYYIFLPDKTYSLQSGEIKCDAGDAEVIKKGKWKIENMDLYIDEVAFDMGYYSGSPQISEDKMVLLDNRKALWVTLTYGTDPDKYGYTKEDSPDDIVVSGVITLYANSNCNLGNEAREYLKKNKFKVNDRCIDNGRANDEMYALLRKDGWVQGNTIQMPVMVINDILYWRDRHSEKFLERLKHGSSEITTSTVTGSGQGGLSASETAHSKEDIIAKWKQAKPLFNDYKNLVLEQPVLQPPYALGKGNEKHYEDALRFLNFIRYIAGLPDDLEMDETLNKRSQSVTLVNAVNGSNSHKPTRPAGMGDDLFLPASEDAIKCNLRIESVNGWFYGKGSATAQGYNFHILSSLIGYAADNDSRNVTRVAHRRNMLRPMLKKTGFGYVKIEESTEDGTNTNYSMLEFSSNHVGDKSRVKEPDYDFILWPPKGYFPTVFFNDNKTGSDFYPWSVAINSKKHKIINPLDISVEVTRKADNAKWVIGKIDYVDQDSHGEEKSFLRVLKGNPYWPETIVFGLDKKATYLANDQYSVIIKGVKDLTGKDVPINYSVEFFDLPCTLLEYPHFDFEKGKIDYYTDEGKNDNISKETKETLKKETAVIKKDKSSTAVATSDGYFMIKNKKAYFTDDSGETPSFIDIIEGYVEQSKPGELYCEFVLADIPKTLTFNHKSLEADQTEYDWSLYFDIDGDGVNDYNIGAYSAKSAGSNAIQQSLSEGLIPGIWKWQGESWIIADGINVNLSQSDNSLIFTLTGLPKDFTLNDRSKFFMRSFYFQNDKNDQAP